jgi:hypothetical protein
MVLVLEVPAQQKVSRDEYSKLFHSDTTMGHILASIPQDYVQRALSETNKHSIRQRVLPNEAMIHFPMLLGLQMDLPYARIIHQDKQIGNCSVAMGIRSISN